MKLLPGTRAQTHRIFRREADTLPILTRINALVVELCRGDIWEAMGQPNFLSVLLFCKVFKFW